MGAGLGVVTLVEVLPGRLLSGSSRVPLLSPPAPVIVAGLWAAAPVGLTAPLPGASTTEAGLADVLPVSLSLLLHLEEEEEEEAASI